MENHENRRENSRLPVPHRRMQIYTSLSAAAYTVNIENLSPQGAFLKTQFVPDIGETISFNLCSPMYEYLHSGSGKVMRVQKEGNQENWGFAVEFDKKIVEDDYVTIIQ